MRCSAPRRLGRAAGTGWALHLCSSQPPIPSAGLHGSQGQRLESGAPGPLGSRMRPVLILLAPPPRCCPGAAAGDGESVPAAPPLLSG